jgi:hypothetical protein
VLFTTRNTVIGCVLSEAVLREPHLKHYQQRFISSYPFQLLEVELSAVVLHVESLTATDNTLNYQQRFKILTAADNLVIRSGSKL